MPFPEGCGFRHRGHVSIRHRQMEQGMEWSVMAAWLCRMDVVNGVWRCVCAVRKESAVGVPLAARRRLKSASLPSATKRP